MFMSVSVPVEGSLPAAQLRRRRIVGLFYARIVQAIQRHGNGKRITQLPESELVRGRKATVGSGRRLKKKKGSVVVAKGGRGKFGFQGNQWELHIGLR